ncbi:hypothetical protein STAS_18157 [Striga asiatica]|uniref:Uncharacterized protein n=1 Tax=Striga asiatica TaxID=4170 RepID=A0A5A7Q825_STRAF|nr:hypothetical protein STAS_18157 [Striga asiatica]
MKLLEGPLRVRAKAKLTGVAELAFYTTKSTFNPSKPLRPRFIENNRLIGHSQAILCNLPKLGHTPQIHLRPILEGNDDVTPFPDKPGHNLDILNDIVREVAPVLARQPGYNRNPKVRESVPQIKRPENCGDSQRQPEEGEAQEEVRQEVAVVSSAVEKDRFFVLLPRGGGIGGRGGGGGCGIGRGRDVELGEWTGGPREGLCEEGFGDKVGGMVVGGGGGGDCGGGG